MKQTLQDRFLQQVERRPHAHALGWYSVDGRLSWHTYEQLFERSLGCATWLGERGVDSGDVCLLVLPSGEPCAFLLLGAVLRGAIPLLMAPPTLQGEPAGRLRALNRIIRKTQPSLVVLDPSMHGMREELASAASRTWFLGGDQHIPGSASGENAIGRRRDDDIAAYQLTSGTTGFPRVCVWKHKSVVAALDGMFGAMKAGEADICLNWTPLYHDMGLVNNFFFCLARGMPLVMLSPLDFVRTPALWLRALHESHATLTWSPNFGFAITAQRVREHEIEGVRLDGVRAFWNAAERIHHDTILRFHQRFAGYGVRMEALKTNFGCAENVGGATFSDPDGAFVVEHVDADALQKQRTAVPVDESHRKDGVATIVSAGKPNPGITIEILSRSGEPLPDGHVGEVALDTPSRMEGYLSDARETRRALLGRLLRTGDLGYTRDGELFWVGRVKERITVRGRKIDPSEFEPILHSVDGLRHGCFVAFGIDDPKHGTQRLVIVAEVRNQRQRDHDDITGEIRERTLSAFGLAVDEVLLVPSGTLAKTSSGKRRHRYFRQQYLDGKLESLAASR